MEWSVGRPHRVIFHPECRFLALREGSAFGKIRRAMVLARESVLGRMTNLFDGVSIMLRENQSQQSKSEAPDIAGECVARSLRKPRIAVTV